MKSPRVLIGADICDDFIARCAGEYHNAERNRHAPRQWAILAGRITDDSIVVQALYDGTNVRDTDHAVILEYRAERAPRFGGVYTDLRRGYLCHPTDLLAVMRKAEAADQQVLGSVHMHADLHNLDRPDELSPTITEMASPIDQDLFMATQWPVNLILYFERKARSLYHTFSAWGVPDSSADPRYRPLPIGLERRDP